VTGAQVFAVDVLELDAQGERTGGQRFLLKTGSRKGLAVDKALGTFDGVDWAPGGCRGCC